MLGLRTAIVSFLLVGACSVGEVPPGTGGQTQTDAGQSGNGTPDSGGAVGDAGGGADSGGGSGVDPAATYTSMILPLLTAQACTGCHPASSPPDLTSYSMIDPKYLTSPGASAKLITGTQAAANHQGPAMSASTASTVAAWIDSLHK
jgi:hypothetical protein